MNRNLYRSVWSVGLVALLINFAIIVYSHGSQSTPWDWVGLIVMLGWSMLPFVVLGMNARADRDNSRAIGVLLTTAALILAGDLFLKWQYLAGPADAQAGLMFVFLPLWELIPVGVGSAVAFLMMTSYRPGTRHSAELPGKV